MKQKITKKLIAVSATLAAILAAGGFLAAQFGFFSGGTNAPSVPEDTMTRGLVGYWSFDEGSGSAAYDASGNGNDGTLIHDPKWTQGKSGSALQFDGVDDYVDCGNNESLNITDAITIEAWVKITSFDEIDAIVYKQSSSDTKDGYNLDIRSANLVYFDVPDGTNWRGITASITSGLWHYIAATYNKVNSKIYIDGVERASEYYTHDLIGNSQHLQIGGRGIEGFRFFNGLIDEVRIYNRALSAEEVRYHYNHGGPVASWNFDEGSGTAVHDSSENGFDGVLHE